MKKILFLTVMLIFVNFFSGCSYNSLVSMEENVSNAWGQVENQYQRRFDLIPNLMSTVQGAAEFEKSTLVDVTEARSKVSQIKISSADLNDPEKFAAFQKAQDGLSSALSKLMVVVEKYPDLKANQNFLNLQSQLESTENRIANERKKYNDAVQQYNSSLRSFPTIISAKIFGFREKQYFKAAEGTDKAPKVNFEFDRKNK